MSTATSAPTTHTTHTARVTRVTRVPTWLYALGSVAVAAVVTGGFEALTRAMGVDYVYGPPGVEPGPMPASGLFFAVLEVGVIGLILAACLARWAKRPRSTWTRTTVTLTVISLVPSLVAASTMYATNVALAVAHVLAAVVIIPAVARRLAETNPRRTA